MLVQRATKGEAFALADGARGNSVTEVCHRHPGGPFLPCDLLRRGRTPDI